MWVLNGYFSQLPHFSYLGELTHTLVSCWMPEPLSPRNQRTRWFAPAHFSWDIYVTDHLYVDCYCGDRQQQLVNYKEEEDGTPTTVRFSYHTIPIWQSVCCFQLLPFFKVDVWVLNGYFSQLPHFSYLGELTHTLISCWMPKPLSPRNQRAYWFAPAHFSWDIYITYHLYVDWYCGYRQLQLVHYKEEEEDGPPTTMRLSYHTIPMW